MLLSALIGGEYHEKANHLSSKEEIQTAAMAAKKRLSGESWAAYLDQRQPRNQKAAYKRSWRLKRESA
jgi:hypothetical protein